MTPDPGIYRGIPDEMYHAWDIASRSMLTRLADERHYTPADVRHEQLTKRPDTEALALGSALHVAMLEPQHYRELVDLGPINGKTGRTYGRDTKAWQDAEGEHPGKILLTTDQAAKVALMAAAVRAHQWARAMCERMTDREVSIIATLDIPSLSVEYDVPIDVDMEDSRLLVKARIDMLCVGAVPLIADLKTTSAATEWEIRKSVADYGYHHQAALYPYLSRQAGLGDIKHFALIVVRSEAPYRAVVLRVTEEAQRIAWQELLPAMVTAARCYREDEWPAWPTGVMDVDLPDWKKREIYA